VAINSKMRGEEAGARDKIKERDVPKERRESEGDPLGTA